MLFCLRGFHNKHIAALTILEVITEWDWKTTDPIVYVNFQSHSVNDLTIVKSRSPSTLIVTVRSVD